MCQFFQYFKFISKHGWWLSRWPWSSIRQARVCKLFGTSSFGQNTGHSTSYYREEDGSYFDECLTIPFWERFTKIILYSSLKLKAFENFCMGFHISCWKSIYSYHHVLFSLLFYFFLPFSSFYSSSLKTLHPKIGKLKSNVQFSG